MKHAAGFSNSPGTIGGPGAFVMVAETPNSFGNVLIKKLIAELAQIEHQ